jgi:hypothetical protein
MAQFRNYFSVYGNYTGHNQLISFSSGADTRIGDIAIKPDQAVIVSLFSGLFS